MSFIVAGKIVVKPGSRVAFLERSQAAIEAARKNGSCLDFAVSPDLVDFNRVNIYEHWDSEMALIEFRESGPDANITTLIASAAVSQFEVVAK